MVRQSAAAASNARSGLAENRLPASLSSIGANADKADYNNGATTLTLTGATGTASIEKNLILLNASGAGGASVVTLPLGTVGQEVTVVLSAAAAGAVTFSDGTNTLQNNGANVSLSALHASARFVYTGVAGQLWNNYAVDDATV